VIGAGPIGLSVVEFAKLTGAKTIVMDMNDQRLAFVRESMGVADTIVTKGDGDELKRLGALTDGQLADVVVDATGSHKSMSQALNYCAFAGRLVYVGITPEAVSFPHAPLLHRRELTLLASRKRARTRLHPHHQIDRGTARLTPAPGSRTTRISTP